MWYIYIVKCADSTLYTGITTDTNRRLKEHNRKKGASYTKVRVPVKLVYKETSTSRSRALKREFEIKSWSRKKKLSLLKKG